MIQFTIFLVDEREKLLLNSVALVLQTVLFELISAFSSSLL